MIKGITRARLDAMCVYFIFTYKDVVSKVILILGILHVSLLSFRCSCYDRLVKVSLGPVNTERLKLLGSTSDVVIGALQVALRFAVFHHTRRVF